MNGTSYSKGFRALERGSAWHSGSIAAYVETLVSILELRNTDLIARLPVCMRLIDWGHLRDGCALGTRCPLYRAGGLCYHIQVHVTLECSGWCVLAGIQLESRT